MVWVLKIFGLYLKVLGLYLVLMVYKVYVMYLISYFWVNLKLLEYVFFCR